MRGGHSQKWDLDIANSFFGQSRIFAQLAEVSGSARRELLDDECRSEGSNASVASLIEHAVSISAAWVFPSGRFGAAKRAATLKSRSQPTYRGEAH
jgi:hypothetical protein